MPLARAAAAVMTSREQGDARLPVRPPLKRGMGAQAEPDSEVLVQPAGKGLQRHNAGGEVR